MKSPPSILRNPELDEIDWDGEERLEIHRQILAKKKMLRVVFREFHESFVSLAGKYLSGNGLDLELGAGVAPIRSSFPNVLATDVLAFKGLDCVIDAQAMNLDENSVRAVFCQNSFHHFPQPDLFFNELERVLVPGGGAVLLEPYFGPIASFVYKRLFRTEGYDKKCQSWDTESEGPMNGANQALSYIVFVRDRALFEKKHPQLRIVHQQVVPNYLKYIFSGGLNFRQLLPDQFIPVLGFFEFLLRPLGRFLALHHIVVIRKVQP